MGIFSKIKERMAKVQQENREDTAVKTAPGEIFDRLRNKLEEVQKSQGKKRGRTKSGSIFDQIKNKFEEAKQENEISTTEDTADPSILERIQKEMEALEKNKKIQIEEKETPPAWGTPSGTPSVDDILGRVIEGAKKEQNKTSKPAKEEDFGSIFDQIMTPTPSASKPKKASKAPDYGDIWEKIATQEAANKSRPTPNGRKSTGLYVGGTALVNSGGSLAMRVAPNMGAGKLRKRLPNNVNVRIVNQDAQNTINIDGVNAGWYEVEYQGQRGWILDIYVE